MTVPRLLGRRVSLPERGEPWACALVGASVATCPEHQARSSTHITTAGGPGLPSPHRGPLPPPAGPQKQARATRSPGHTEGPPTAPAQTTGGSAQRSNQAPTAKHRGVAHQRPRF